MRARSMHGFLFLLVPALSSAGAPAQDPDKLEPPAVDQARIDAAIAKGAEWLRMRLKFGLPPINEAHEGLHAGQTFNELVLYTLLHAGVDRGDPDLIRLIQTIRAKPPVHTYTGAIRAMALVKYDAVALRGDIVNNLQFLVDNQSRTGQWGYSHPIPFPAPSFIKFTPTLVGATPPPPRYTRTGPSGAATDDNDPEITPATPRSALPANTQVKAPGESSGPGTSTTQPRKPPPKLLVPRNGFSAAHDNSNSQYALLGISACMSAGVFPSPDCLDLAEKWWTKCQQADGGWNYGDGKPVPSYGGMTAGGVSSLAVCLQGDGKGRDPLKDERVKRGITWLAQNMSIGSNPFSIRTKYYWDTYYWIYAVERAGSLAGTEFFGDRAWYSEGVGCLLGGQGADGTWGSGVNDGAKILDTCWAILFLRRSTKQIRKKMVEYTYTKDSRERDTAPLPVAAPKKDEK